MGQFEDDLPSQSFDWCKDPPAFSTNHLTDNDKTKYNYNTEHHARKILTYLQTKPNKTKAWCRGLLHHQARKMEWAYPSSPGPACSNN